MQSGFNLFLREVGGDESDIEATLKASVDG
jgi:hypothetical protein